MCYGTGNIMLFTTRHNISPPVEYGLAHPEQCRILPQTIHTDRPVQVSESTIGLCKIYPMYSFLCLCILTAWAREIIIAPQSSLVFMEAMESGKVFKLVYKSNMPVHVTVTDPEGRDIVEQTDREGTIYTGIDVSGRIKTTIQNLSKERCTCSFVCPDVNKEVSGHVGYVKDIDMVSELARSLDDLLFGQKQLIARTLQHQGMVTQTRFWANMLMSFEFVLTAIMIYILHKDFIAMFEKKQML